MTVCVRFIVSGRVQGVCFRAETRSQAQALGIVGYAKNLPDGRVEVLACGEKDTLDRLQDWLWQGPPAAHVEGVQVAAVAESVARGFTIE